MGMGVVEHMHINRRLGSIKIEFSPAFSFPIEKIGPISTESFGKMVFAVQGWKAAAIPSVLFSRGLHFSLLPVILFTVITKYQLDFACWICSPITNGLKSFRATVDLTEPGAGKTRAWGRLHCLAMAGGCQQLRAQPALSEPQCDVTPSLGVNERNFCL